MRILRATILLALLVVIVSAAFVGYRIFLGGSSDPLPSFKGTSVVEAVAALEKMGLQARIDQQDSTLPVGTVIAQFPETGIKVRKDKPVLLRVSRGTALAPLPDLRGQSESSAATQLQNLGFVVGDMIKVNSSEAPGTVIAQNPAAPASVSKSQKVDLMVSLGPTAAAGKTVVPDVVEKTISKARDLLSASNLRTAVTMFYTKATPDGMVVSISPKAGTTVPLDSEVNLTVATTDRRYAPKAEATTVTATTTEATHAASPEGETATTTSTSGARVIMVAPADGTGTPPAAQRPATSDVSPTVATAPTTATTSVPPVTTVQTSASAPGSTAGKSIAHIRYQVPPVKGMSLRIEMTDRNGVRNLLNRQAKPGEMISLNAPFTGEAVVTIFLGGEFVWQDRYK